MDPGYDSYLVRNKTNYLEKLALFIIEGDGEKEEKGKGEKGEKGRGKQSCSLSIFQGDLYL